jgi:hypothetical protein
VLWEKKRPWLLLLVRQSQGGSSLYYTVGRGYLPPPHPLQAHVFCHVPEDLHQSMAFAQKNVFCIRAASLGILTEVTMGMNR